MHVPKDVQQPAAADDSSAAAPVASMAAPEKAAPAADAETPTAFKCATCGAFKDYQAQKCKKGCQPVKKLKTEAADGAPKAKVETPEVRAKPLGKVKLCTKHFDALFDELRGEEDDKKRDVVQAEKNLTGVRMRIKQLEEIQAALKAAAKGASDDSGEAGASDPPAGSDPAAM